MGTILTSGNCFLGQTRTNPKIKKDRSENFQFRKYREKLDFLVSHVFVAVCGLEVV